MARRSRPTVLHVAAPSDGGVPRYVAALARDQERRGWSVAVASPAGGDLERLLAATPVRLLDWTAAREPGVSAAREAVRLARIVRHVDPDLVHLHSAKAGLVGRLAIRGRRPTIFTPNAWSFEALKGLRRQAAAAWEQFAARWTDLILCVSEAERALGAELVEAQWQVVRTGIDVDAFPARTDEDRRASRRRLGLNGGRVAVCVGRLCEQKGQDVLVRAWPAVAARVPDAELVLVGDGPDRATLERLASSGVRFAGARDDVADWLTAADVVVQPSRWEGMSIVMLETMASGRSLVMSDVNGVREALEGAGAIVPVGDSAAIERALVERLLDPALTAAEGERARARVESFHTFARTAEAIAAVYANVLGDDSGGPPAVPASGRAVARPEAVAGARS